MDILHVSAECFPAAKVGGLADVVGALPKYQNKKGIISRVVIPFCANNFTENNKLKTVYKNKLKLGSTPYGYEIIELKEKLGFQLFLVRISGLLDRKNVYGYDDDAERFLSFQIAVLNWVLQSDTKPSIIHCHDNHTGLIPFMMSHSKKYKTLKNIPNLLTIHNAQYQGQFGYDKLDLIPDFDQKHIGLLDWDSQINPLATAIKCAWRITTVSPSYLEELKSNARGLESLIRHESDKFSGILNGIDLKVWNPETDDYIIENYSEKIV